MAKRNRVQFQKGPNGPKLHNMDIRKNRIRSEFESCEGFGAENAERLAPWASFWAYP